MLAVTFTHYFVPTSSIDPQIGKIFPGLLSSGVGEKAQERGKCWVYFKFPIWFSVTSLIKVLRGQFKTNILLMGIRLSILLTEISYHCREREVRSQTCITLDIFKEPGVPALEWLNEMSWRRLLRDFSPVPPICGPLTTPKLCSHSLNFPILKDLSHWVMIAPQFTFTLLIVMWKLLMLLTPRK